MSCDCTTNHAADPAGSSPASSRQLRAALSVTHELAVEQPQLQGQVEGSADATGVITISALTLTAVPGQYFLNVTLPDYPQVGRSHHFGVSQLTNTMPVWCKDRKTACMTNSKICSPLLCLLIAALLSAETSLALICLAPVLLA